jgi:hypothetical protein
MPATLSQFWTAETARIDALLATARTDATAAATAESAAAADLTLAGKQQQDAQARAGAARKKLAGIPMPADGDPILMALRTAIADMRSAAARQVTADAVLRARRAARARNAAVVAALAAQLALAQASAKAEQTGGARRQLAQLAATSAPLKDLPAAAGAALASHEAAARANVEGDFPSNADPDRDFLTRVRARRALAATQLTSAAAVAHDARASSTTWEESSTRESAKSASLQRDFDARSADLQALIDAPARVQQAAAQLKALAERIVSPLTPSQKADLHTANVALATLREEGLVLLKAVDDAQGALIATGEAYAKLLLATMVANPGKTEEELLASVAALQAKKTEVLDAKAAMDAAAADPDYQSHEAALKHWFGAVPDALWEQLDALDTALADLAAVQAIVPATLVAALVAAEDALAVQWQKVVTEQLLMASLARTLAGDEADAARENDLATARQQAAVRFVERV